MQRLRDRSLLLLSCRLQSLLSLQSRSLDGLLAGCRPFSPALAQATDIPLLVDHFINHFNARTGKRIAGLSFEAMRLFMHYDFPGNIRELENVLERAVINSSGPKLHLVDELKKPHQDLTTAKKTLDEVERDYIVQVLEQTCWKVSGKNGAAEILGLNRSTLRARIRKLGIHQS